MTSRRGRAGERGSETLELVAVLPLIGLVLLLAWQGVVLVRQEFQAQADAHALARQAVLCARAVPPSRLADVDPAPGTATVTDVSGQHGGLVRVEVRLDPSIVMPGFDKALGSSLAPHATVVMRREPC
ncbi:MAG TPA: hypothetical protein VGQ42_06630 [Candidatus Dormibacteraeota bacterium]|jgi:hypothetical protein|nr:hypothetical protein [Candidatus Dormibacteraeota bacterium]